MVHLFIILHDDVPQSSHRKALVQDSWMAKNESISTSLDITVRSEAPVTSSSLYYVIRYYLLPSYFFGYPGKIAFYFCDLVMTSAQM